MAIIDTIKMLIRNSGRMPDPLRLADEDTASTHVSRNIEDDCEKEEKYGAIREMTMLQTTSDLAKQSHVNTGSSPKSKKLLTLNLLIVPFAFCYILGMTSVMLIRNSLFLNKVCLNFLNYSIEICGNLSADQLKLNAAQQVVNNYSLYATIIATVPSAMVSFFIGGMTNEHLRKVRVLIALFGVLAEDLGYLLNSIYMEWPLSYILIVSLPSGLLGGTSMVLAYMYTFIGEKFPLEYRTLVFAIEQVATAIGTVAGSFFSGQLLKLFGYRAVYCLAIACHSICVLYILFGTKTSKSFGEQGFKVLAKEFFRFSTFLENLGAFTKKRKNNGRLELALLNVALIIILSSTSLHAGILFLYCNKVFSWDYTKYSTIYTIGLTCATVGTLTFTPIMTKILGMKDSTIGAVGTLTVIAQNLSYGLSYKEWIYYIGTAMTTFSDFSVFAITARVSKVVAENELGQVFAVAASLFSLAPLLESLLATRIYNATVSIFPGMMLIVMAVLLLFPFFLFLWTRRREINDADQLRVPLLPITPQHECSN